MNEDLLRSMVDSVRAAARICRTVQADLVQAGTLEKGDKSPVTIADLASQAVIAHALAELHPDIPLMGEEDSSVLAGEERRPIRAQVLERVQTEWRGADETVLLRAIDRGRGTGHASARFFTLDPIDGTKGFLRGDQYAVALGVIEDGRETLGVLGCPNFPNPDGGLGMIFAAVRGRGARWIALDGEGIDGPQIRASNRSDPVTARFCESVVKAHSHQGVSAQVQHHMGVEAAPVRMDSQCKYALLATGAAEVYMRIPRDPTRSENLWDHAAGGLLVEESGGRVTDLDGKPLDFGRGRTLTANRGILASNRHVHDAVLDAIKAVGA